MRTANVIFTGGENFRLGATKFLLVNDLLLKCSSITDEFINSIQNNEGEKNDKGGYFNVNH
jgi:hypothetical protein